MKLGIEVGLGNADARGLRGRKLLGAADIGAPAQHVGRHAHRHLQWCDRDVLLAPVSIAWTVPVG